MAMNISCKFEKASYNIFFVRAVTVKSLCTLRRRRRNEVKSIVSTGCYPVDTNISYGVQMNVNSRAFFSNGFSSITLWILMPKKRERIPVIVPF